MLTLNMEIGLITPPVGLNLYVINGIVKDVELKTVLWGALPFMLCLLFGIFLLAVFPAIATHDAKARKHADRVVRLKGGKLEEF